MSEKPLPVTLGQRPKASPPARTWTVILGIVLLAGAVVAGREAWVVGADEGGQSWLQPFIDVMSKPDVETWMLIGGGIGIVVGLILLWAACAPRKTTHVRIASEDASMWLRAVDIARIASAAARRVPGVSAARSRAKISANRASLTVTATGDLEDAQLKERITDAVEAALAAVSPSPELTVVIENDQEEFANV